MDTSTFDQYVCASLPAESFLGGFLMLALIQALFSLTKSTTLGAGLYWLDSQKRFICSLDIQPSTNPAAYACSPLVAPVDPVVSTNKVPHPVVFIVAVTMLALAVQPPRLKFRTGVAHLYSAFVESLWHVTLAFTGARSLLLPYTNATNKKQRKSVHHFIFESSVYHKKQKEGMLPLHATHSVMQVHQTWRNAIDGCMDFGHNTHFTCYLPKTLPIKTVNSVGPAHTMVVVDVCCRKKCLDLTWRIFGAMPIYNKYIDLLTTFLNLDERCEHWEKGPCLVLSSCPLCNNMCSIIAL